MKRYFFLFLLISIFILITFFISEQYHIPLLQNPTYVLQKGGMVAALTGIGLLIADVIFPIPSSLIMIANGAVFGIWMGTLLSMIGGVLATLTGFYLGKRSSTLINKFISDKEQQTAKALMQKWGMTALIVSRSIPVLAETVSIIAGTAQMKWQQILWASVIGLFPAAIIYAVTGAMSLQIESAAWSFVLVLIVAAIFWSVGRFAGKKFDKGIM
jgi:uncharacterized membrane protein YdjX (TVP38/TMEM64 family)